MDFTDTHGIYKKKAEFSGKLNITKLLQKFVMKQSMDTNLEEFKKASPFWRIQHNNAIPRIMVVHGTIDTLVPYEDGRLFYKEITKKRFEDFRNNLKEESDITIETFRNPSDIFVKLPEAHHAFNFIVSPRTLALSDAVVDFISHIYKETQGQTSKL